MDAVIVNRFYRVFMDIDEDLSGVIGMDEFHAYFHIERTPFRCVEAAADASVRSSLARRLGLLPGCLSHRQAPPPPFPPCAAPSTGQRSRVCCDG